MTVAYPAVSGGDAAVDTVETIRSVHNRLWRLLLCFCWRSSWPSSQCYCSCDFVAVGWIVAVAAAAAIELDHRQILLLSVIVGCCSPLSYRPPVDCISVGMDCLAYALTLMTGLLVYSSYC